MGENHPRAAVGVAATGLVGAGARGPVGVPWKTVHSELGDVPFYVISFDKDGACTSPLALESLIEASRAATDVVVFSHGWNNDWDAATGRYEEFIKEFIAVRRQYWSPPTRPFSPVLAGVFWPSTALVMPWEEGPDIAGGDGSHPDAQAVAEALDPARRAGLVDLLGAPAPDLGALAAMLAPLVSGLGDEFGPGPDPVTPEALLAAWGATTPTRPQTHSTIGGFIEDEAPPGFSDTPAAAGFNPLEKVRDALRATTVWLMKDRAARVGGNGVARLLSRLAESSNARIALVGHSYGCIVVLSALCGPPSLSRRAESVLLLQAALSGYAFAEDVDGRPGGYRDAANRVRQPIIATYSKHDAPLTKFFHWAVRRKSDRGQAVIAAEGGPPPSKFAALGGYGPQGVAARWIDMPDPGVPYPLSTSERFIAADASKFIGSHGAVQNPHTAWALLNQLEGPGGVGGL